MTLLEFANWLEEYLDAPPGTSRGGGPTLEAVRREFARVDLAAERSRIAACTRLPRGIARRILGVLAEPESRDGLTSGEIALRIYGRGGFDEKARISPLISLVSRLGLVEHHADRRVDDRRKFVWTLTPAGVEAVGTKGRG